MATRNPRADTQATPPFRSVAFTLSSLGYAISRRFQQVLEPVQLEPGQFALLRAVAAGDGESQNVLAERLHISPSWMVAIVDDLENRRFLQRLPHARDRRVRTLQLTALGKKLLKQAEQRATRFDRQVTDPLSEAEIRQLLDLLGRVAAALELQPGAHTALRERRQESEPE